MIIEYRMYLKFLQKPRCLGWFKTSQALWSALRKTNKVEFLERKFHSEKPSFVHKKESEHSFELSLSTCVFCRRIFNLEMQNFSLENQHMMNAHQPLSWRMTSAKVLNSGFFPTPYLVAHLIIVGEGGCGWFSLGKNFFPKTLELKLFSLTYNGAKCLFSIIYVMRVIFSIAVYHFSQVYTCKLFPLEINVQDIFFLKSPITFSKVKLSAAKINPNIGSVDRHRFFNHF